MGEVFCRYIVTIHAEMSGFIYPFGERSFFGYGGWLGHFELDPEKQAGGEKDYMVTQSVCSVTLEMGECLLNIGLGRTVMNRRARIQHRITHLFFTVT